MVWAHKEIMISQKKVPTNGDHIQEKTNRQIMNEMERCSRERRDGKNVSVDMALNRERWIGLLVEAQVPQGPLGYQKKNKHPRSDGFFFLQIIINNI